MVIVGTLGWLVWRGGSRDASAAGNYYQAPAGRLLHNLSALGAASQSPAPSLENWLTAVTGVMQDCQSVANGPEVPAAAAPAKRRAAANLHSICHDLTPLAAHSRQVLLALQPLTADNPAAAARQLQTVSYTSADPGQAELLTILQDPAPGRPLLPLALSYQTEFWQAQVQLPGLLSSVRTQAAALGIVPSATAAPAGTAGTPVQAGAHN